MSRQINQPSNQIRLTNVSLVRLKKGKKRFEIACYKNKVLEWRQGIETDLDNVLQIPSVFLNVSKGQTAPKEDLERAFGRGRPANDVLLEILARGELQVGDKERAAQLERVHAEVLGLVSAKLVDPRSSRPYTTGMIEKALDMLSQQAHHSRTETTKTTRSAAVVDKGGSREDSDNHDDKHDDKNDDDDDSQTVEEEKESRKDHIWTGVVATRSAKSQALEAIKALVAHQPIPVARARMRLRVSCPTSLLKQTVKDAAAASTSTTEAKGSGGGGKVKSKKNKGKGKANTYNDDNDDNDDSNSKKTLGPSDDNADDHDHDQPEHKTAGTVKDRILAHFQQVESQDVVGSDWEVVGFAEPGAYRTLFDFIFNNTKGRGGVEVLDMAVTHED